LLRETLGPEAVVLKKPYSNREWRICIIDGYGILEDMYMIADCAVVGGSFNSVGGHNVWEAAQFGIPVLWGPNYHTQKQSCDHLMEAGVGFSVLNSTELCDKLVHILKTDAKSFIRAEMAFMEKTGRGSQRLQKAIP
jgi:3-deoxy-D-manno-octulosonic-acid transferase